ncbi:MAG: ribonuclease H-like YkuK family protein [Anaerolineaceae bacterium]
MFTEDQIKDLIDLLYGLDENTKIYMGTDSVRFKKDGRWHAKYASVCVVHMNGANGCRVFTHRSIEPDYDVRKDRPSMRLMNEVMKTCELYVQLAPFIDCYDIELHVDVNTDPIHGSNCVATQAAGYILGVTGVAEDQIKLKPDAFAASFSADHMAHRG